MSFVHLRLVKNNHGQKIIDESKFKQNMFCSVDKNRGLTNRVKHAGG